MISILCAMLAAAGAYDIRIQPHGGEWQECPKDLPAIEIERVPPECGLACPKDPPF
jgi:hypothetical protein